MVGSSDPGDSAVTIINSLSTETVAVGLAWQAENIAKVLSITFVAEMHFSLVIFYSSNFTICRYPEMIDPKHNDFTNLI